MSDYNSDDPNYLFDLPRGPRPQKGKKKRRKIIHSPDIPDVGEDEVALSTGGGAASTQGGGPPGAAAAPPRGPAGGAPRAPPPGSSAGPPRDPPRAPPPGSSAGSPRGQPGGAPRAHPPGSSAGPPRGPPGGLPGAAAGPPRGPPGGAPRASPPGSSAGHPRGLPGGAPAPASAPGGGGGADPAVWELREVNTTGSTTSLTSTPNAQQSNPGPNNVTHNPHPSQSNNKEPSTKKARIGANLKVGDEEDEEEEEDDDDEDEENVNKKPAVNLVDVDDLNPNDWQKGVNTPEKRGISGASAQGRGSGTSTPMGVNTSAMLGGTPGTLRPVLSSNSMSEFLSQYSNDQNFSSLPQMYQNGMLIAGHPHEQVGESSNHMFSPLTPAPNQQHLDFNHAGVHLQHNPTLQSSSKQSSMPTSNLSTFTNPPPAPLLAPPPPSLPEIILQTLNNYETSEIRDIQDSLDKELFLYSFLEALNFNCWLPVVGNSFKGKDGLPSDPSVAGKRSHAISKTRRASSSSTYNNAEQERQSQNVISAHRKNPKKASDMQKQGQKKKADDKEDRIKTEISVSESLFCKKCKVDVERMSTVRELIVRCEAVLVKIDEGKSTKWNCYNGREKCVKVMEEWASGLKKKKKQCLPYCTNITNQKKPPTILDDGNFKVTFPEGFARGPTDFKEILKDLKKLLAAEGEYKYDGGSGRWHRV
ncbi:hypothetical protein TrRE_jg10709 [Triparma retinervis]|uniref:Uncharacterized protein n=1 Tax=Triparma retinervis TaxID=2557542 RepID=A0A9W7EE74_9STRA|nr:hypothetical protein TrRE_jg10709 [Triparma retinervis]